MAFDPLSPEVAYALKGNIVAPVGSNAAAMAASASSRLNDAYAQNPAQLGYTAPTVTVPAGDIRVATSVTLG